MRPLGNWNGGNLRLWANRNEGARRAMVKKNEHLAWDGSLGAASGKIEDCCDLFPRQVEPLHDLLHGGSCFEILEGSDAYHC